MKSIKLKKEKEKILLNGQTQEADFATIDLIRAALTSPSKDGYSVSDISKRLKILNVLDLVKDDEKELLLEDADHQILSHLVGNMRWGVISKFIKDFAEDLSKVDL